MASIYFACKSSVEGRICVKLFCSSLNHVYHDDACVNLIDYTLIKLIIENFKVIYNPFWKKIFKKFYFDIDFINLFWWKIFI